MLIQPSSSDQSQDTAQSVTIKKNSAIKFWPITRHGSVWNNQEEFSHQVLTNHKTRLSLEQSRRIQSSSSDQLQDMVQFGTIKKNSASSPNQSQITVQFSWPTCGSETTSWPSSYFTIKGGPPTPSQHHPTRKNVPETTISLTTHPPHSPELTTTLIKYSGGVFLS